jgi:hypothetical protein
MSLTVSYSPSAAFKRVPAGQWPSRCIGVIDLGSQKTQFPGEEEKLSRQCILQFEVYGEDEMGVPLTVEHEGHEVPLQISTKRMTMSLNEKANLRKTLHAWRGRDFTPEELKAFNIGTIIGAPALLNVVHEEGKNGKVYAGIFSITPLPAAMKKGLPAKPTKTIVFDLDEFDADVFDGLSQYLQDIIKESVEFKSRKPPAPVAPVAAAAPAAAPATAFDDMDSDIPF